MTVIRKIPVALLVAACAAPLLMLVGVVIDIDGFEYPYILRLLGASGVAMVLVLLAGPAYLCWRGIRVLAGRSARLRPAGAPGWILLALWGIAALWWVDWLLLNQRPVSLGIADSLRSERETPEPASLASGQLARLPVDRPSFNLTIDRVVANRPCDYDANRIIALVEDIAPRHGVEPALLYFWLYLGSFYGEALSGRVPFLKGMTSETIRDFAQLHLPAWFVESDLRRRIVESTSGAVRPILGKPAWKWRYALQKATYDSSIEPYDTNVYSDIFVVMRAYRGEFPELADSWASDSAVDRVLRTAFVELEHSFMPGDVLAWDAEAPWNADDYGRHRQPLKRYARAVFYKMLFDLEFATRVQSLVARHYDDRLRQALGAEYWDRVPGFQKVLIFALMRDVYQPSIGRTSANLYNLPEFNLAPLRFMIDSIRVEPAELLSESQAWLPDDADNLLWGGTTKLRALSEYWNLYYGHTLPGIDPTRTLPAARQVVARESGCKPTR